MFDMITGSRNMAQTRRKQIFEDNLFPIQIKLVFAHILFKVETLHRKDAISKYIWTTGKKKRRVGRNFPTATTFGYWQRCPYPKKFDRLVFHCVPTQEGLLCDFRARKSRLRIMRNNNSSEGRRICEIPYMYFRRIMWMTNVTLVTLLTHWLAHCTVLHSSI